MGGGVKGEKGCASWLKHRCGQIAEVVCVVTVAVLPPVGDPLFQSLGVVDSVPLDINFRHS